MNAKRGQQKKSEGGFKGWFRRLRGFGVMADDGEKALWVYFDGEEDEFVHYGGGNNNSNGNGFQPQ